MREYEVSKKSKTGKRGDACLFYKNKKIRIVTLTRKIMEEPAGSGLVAGFLAERKGKFAVVQVYGRFTW